MFLIKTFYQYIKDSFEAPLKSVIKNFNIFQKNSVNPIFFLSKQLYTIHFYILTKSILSHNKKSLQKSLYTQQKKLSSLTKDCNLLIFTANKTITNLTQYELSQESDLLKAGMNEFFEKIHCSFLNNLKSEETKSQIKTSLSYLANCDFYN